MVGTRHATLAWWVVAVTAAAGSDHGQSECVITETSGPHCRQPANRPVRDQLLLQMHVGGSAVMTSTVATRSSVQLLQAHDSKMASHIRKLSKSPADVARVIQRGLLAILDAVAHFSASPPRVVEGIMILGADLLEAIELLLPTETATSQGFTDFKDAWTASFERLHSAVQSISADIDLYVAEGDPPILIRAIDSIIQEAGTIVMEFLPIQTAIEVEKYLNAVSEAFDTMGISWDEFANGRIVDGIEAVYWGLRGITDGLMPEVLKDNEIYQTIIGTLDVVLGNLTKTVLSYERHILESSVCWRTEKMRHKNRPSKCPANYAWDGLTDCFPMVTAAGSFLEGNKSRAVSVAKQATKREMARAVGAFEPFGLGECRAYSPGHNPSTWYLSQPDFTGGKNDCEALCMANPRCKAIEFMEPHHCEIWVVEPQSTSEVEGGSCYKRGGGELVAGRPVPAQCATDYPEKHGQYCYDTCPGGFHVKHGTNAKCQSSCVGDYPAESPQMCGKNQGMLTKAILEMVTTVMNGVFSLAENIVKMKENGVDAEILVDTIQTFIDMGKPFANPTCPEWELTDPTVAPTEDPTVCSKPCGLGAAPGECRLESGGLVICLAASAGTCAEGQTTCSGEDTTESTTPQVAVCSTQTKLYLTSHSWNQLQDSYGTVGFSPNSQGWERWTLSDAGDGKVFITSHRHAHLQDSHGHVGLSWNRQGWERWTISAAGNGKVYIASHQDKYLTDSHGRPAMSSSREAAQAWTLTDVTGAPACTFF
eukprot:TRINITY_DN6929_c0_g1_i1.p1 TRINITY_DN6929_c0_g1~~TRINITY_DN6929_c0_g1_i1.p1  ORF type:complete len:764 (-),score=122.55 TRINITY_DN6929_c0_g1_i1:485-2776(-)